MFIFYMCAFFSGCSLCGRVPQVSLRYYRQDRPNAHNSPPTEKISDGKDSKKIYASFDTQLVRN